MRLTSDREDHESCVSFSENKTLELEKQEHMSLDNTWITDNRTERKKKRSYVEVVYNLKEVKVTDSVEEKISTSQQRVDILENVNFGKVNFSDIYQDLLRDEETNSSRIVSPPKICVNTSPSCNNSNQDKIINPRLFLILKIKIF